MSFRKYGGLHFSANNNYTFSNFSTTRALYTQTSGPPSTTMTLSTHAPNTYTGEQPDSLDTFCMNDCQSLDELIHYIHLLKIYMNRIEFTSQEHQVEFSTIRDEILGLINRFVYLASLK